MAGQRPALPRLAALTVLAAAFLAVSPYTTAQMQPSEQRAVLQGLDKTTARVSTIEVPVEGAARFGTLEIVARACHKKPPTEPPESAAFLEILDVRPDSPAVEVFTGWMFASSPAVSALEHPVYDVWVIDCRTGPAVEAAAEAEADAAAAPRLDEPPETGDAPVDSEAAPAD